MRRWLKFVIPALVVATLGWWVFSGFHREDDALLSFEGSPDSQVVQVYARLGSNDHFPRVIVVKEDADAVIVLLRVWRTGGAHTSVGVEGPHDVTLKSPLGSRSLRTADGKVLPQCRVGMDPGCPG